MQTTQFKEQAVQEAFYEFPYHYVAQFRKGFTQVYCDTWGLNYVSTIDLLIQKLRQAEFSSLVDIGCGDGRLVFELSKEFPEKLIHGIDYSEKAIGMARALNPHLNFRALDICSQKPDRQYEAATLMEVYEHIHPEMASAFVDAVASLLIPGGLLLVTVPHKNKPVEPHHFRHFDIETLTRELGTRFTIEQTMPFEKRSPLRRLISTLLYNRFFMLNHARTLRMIYRFYMRNLLAVSDESQCQRLMLLARRK